MDEMNFQVPLELIIPNEKHIALMLVGCGGTGSWMAPAVVRVGKILIERFNREVSIYFIDPDLVEEKNIYRQNFCAAEIGMNKAEALAMRYGLAWGIEIHTMARKYSQATPSIKNQNLMIVIGCVDRASARKEISGSVNSSDLHVWLDCGNSESYGQVLLGVKSTTIDLFPMPGKCSG
ncbi:MAG: ThiF family protein, partial [uncultured bacterium]